MKLNIMLRGLYAITDTHLTPFDTIITQITAAIEGGAKILQFRYKGEINEDILIKVNEIQTLCREKNVLFIINDHKKLAKEIDADGIHVGKDDENDLQTLRKQFAGKILGVSCYGDIDRAKRAENAGADYVAFGSFFHSPTKPNSSVVPKEIISQAKRELNIPICVIGGINLKNATDLITLGADMVAVISGLWGCDNIQKCAARFDQLLHKKKHVKEAIILLNMGGPNNLDEVKVFLNNMFNDHRIIQAPKLIRKFIAFMIVKFRLKEATNNYKELGGKSPIVDYTKSLITKVEEKTGTKTTFAMRYTPPFTKEALHTIKNADKIYAIPLYPHFSSTTTLSSFDALFEEAEKLGIKDKIVTVDNYHLNQKYNEAIVHSIQNSLNEKNPANYDLIFSAHGLPQKIIDKGDPYQKHIQENVDFATKLLEKQGIKFANVHLAYQSRVGPMKWTRPYLDEKLKELKNKNVILYPIAFTVDNSETEFELDIEYREIAEEIGLNSYKVAKAPNDSPLFIEALENIYQNMT